MTDNEIVIALRAVAEKYKGKFVATCETNISEMATDAANHIERLCDANNRQKAEIERLQKDLDIINAANTELYGAFEENERLKSEIERLEKHTELYHELKSEARKEFAERLKATPIRYRIERTEYCDKLPITKMVPFIDNTDIDNLVKEMETET